MNAWTGIAVALGLAATPVTAAVIVDTGQSPYVGKAGMNIDPIRIAAGFHTSAATLTKVEWGIGAPFSAVGGARQLFTFHIVLYRANGAVPGAELYSAEARFNGQPGWHGVDGLAWKVPAGDYFVAVELREGDACECVVSETTPRPLPLYAVAARADLPYIASPQPLGSAVRIEGTLTPP